MATNNEQNTATKKAAEKKAAEEKTAQDAAEKKAAEEKEEQKDVEKAVKDDAVFSRNPKLDVYFRTSDGVAFFTQNDARNHAKTLKDATVKKVTK
jgi:hypothetical protein